QINGSTFDQLLQGNPEIAVRMMRKLSRRLRETDEMLKSFLGTKVTASREMPRPVAQVVAEGPEKLVHVPSGMEFPLSNGPETTIGRMNSTFLNGKRLETGVPAEIRPGDEVRFGVVILRFEGA